MSWVIILSTCTCIFVHNTLRLNLMYIINIINIINIKNHIIYTYTYTNTYTYTCIYIDTRDIYNKTQQEINFGNWHYAPSVITTPQSKAGGSNM